MTARPLSPTAPTSLTARIASRLTAIAPLLVLTAILAQPPAAHAEITPVSTAQCNTMIARRVITNTNPVPCSRLASVTFDYTDFEGTIKQGTVVVLNAVAPQVESLFGELLLRSIPLASVQPLENFDGDDRKSMAANNTSAFNGREMTGGKGWSKHAYGVAIDINPIQNPYVSDAGRPQQEVLPAEGIQHLQRTPVTAGMAEEVVSVFYDHGFLIWGGNWQQPIDYQHFEIGSRAFIRTLISLPRHKAQAEFEAYVARYRACIRDGMPAASSPADEDTPEDIGLRDRCAARMRR